MARLRQVFVNSTDHSLIVFLELSTSRYRIAPGQELTLFYDDNDEGNGPGQPLRVEYMMSGKEPQLVIWTLESDMYLPDGSEALTNYD